MENKGQVNVETVTKVIVLVLGLAIMAVVTILILAIMSSNQVIPQGTLSRLTINESGAGINATGYTFRNATLLGFSNAVIVTAINNSGGVIASPNYTIVSGNTIFNATNVTFPNVNVTYTFSVNTQTANDALAITGNTSSANVTFFTQVPTIFTVLGVALIIGFIAIIIFAVRRLRNGSDNSYT